MIKIRVYQWYIPVLRLADNDDLSHLWHACEGPKAVRCNGGPEQIKVLLRYGCLRI